MMVSSPRDVMVAVSEESFSSSSTESHNSLEDDGDTRPRKKTKLSAVYRARGLRLYTVLTVFLQGATTTRMIISNQTTVSDQFVENTCFFLFRPKFSTHSVALLLLLLLMILSIHSTCRTQSKTRYRHGCQFRCRIRFFPKRELAFKGFIIRFHQQG